MVSGTFVLTNEDYEDGFWTVKSGPGSTYGIGAKIAEVSVPAITDSIFNTGLVLVYLKVPEGLTTTTTQWTPLPFMLRALRVGYFNSIKYVYNVGVIHIAYLFEKSDSDVDMPNIRDATVPEYEFKYVVIAGEVAANMEEQGIDTNDYLSVIDYLDRNPAGY